MTLFATLQASLRCLLWALAIPMNHLFIELSCAFGLKSLDERDYLHTNIQLRNRKWPLSPLSLFHLVRSWLICCTINPVLQSVDDNVPHPAHQQPL